MVRARAVPGLGVGEGAWAVGSFVDGVGWRALMVSGGWIGYGRVRSTGRGCGVDGEDDGRGEDCA